MDSNLTPHDWKTLCKSTLSKGDFLHYSSEWCEVSKRNAWINAQTSNPDWDANMLLGENQCESNTNQIVFPVGVYAQVAMTASHTWNHSLAKGDLSGNLVSIRQPPDELFQDFVDRLLKTVSRIFGDS